MGASAVSNADVTLDRITALELLDLLRTHERYQAALDMVDALRHGPRTNSPLTTENARLRQELQRAIDEGN